MRKRKTTPWVRRRRRVYLIFAIVAVLLAPAVVWRLRLKAEVRQEFAALRAADIPTTPEELAAWEAQFPKLTPVVEYEKAVTAFVPLAYEVSQDFPSFRMRHEGAELFAVPYDGVTLDAMRQFVELNGETLRLLREARSVASEGEMAKNWARQDDDIVALCCANTCVRAEAVDGAGAMEAVLDGLVLLKSMNAAPWSQSLWRPSDAVGQLMRALASAACRVSLPEARLREIQGLLAAPHWEEEMRLAGIQGAATMVVELSSQQLDAPQARIADTVFGFFDRYMSSSMRSERLRLGLIGKSIAEQQAVFDALKGSGVSRDFSFSGSPMHLVVAAAGIEVLCYYQNNGKLPDSLDVLVRDGLALEDFFAGKPLAYRPEGTLFTLYSVGRDLKDDGGSGRDDVVFRAQWPPK